MSASSRPTRAPVERQGQRQVHGGGGLADAALAGRHGDHVADARQRLQPALHRLGATRQRTSTRAGPIAGLRPPAAARGRGQFGAVAAGRKAQLDLDDRRAALQPDGLHSFGVAQGHPEVWFDIILDHTADFADARVCHGAIGRTGERHAPGTSDCSGRPRRGGDARSGAVPAGILESPGLAPVLACSSPGPRPDSLAAHELLHQPAGRATHRRHQGGGRRRRPGGAQVVRQAGEARPVRDPADHRRARQCRQDRDGGLRRRAERACSTTRPCRWWWRDSATATSARSRP